MATSQKSDFTNWNLHHNLLKGVINNEETVVEFLSSDEKVALTNKVLDHAAYTNELKLLKEAGISETGFNSATGRYKCWHAILQSQLKLNKHFKNKKESKITIHPDEQQVHLDVIRSFSFVKNVEEKEQLRNVLEETIVNLLRKYPTLRYYQGFHDIVSVFIMVFIVHPNTKITKSENPLKSHKEHRKCHDEHESNHEIFEEKCRTTGNNKMMFKCLEAFTLLYLRDFMMDSLKFPIDQTHLIFMYIKKENPTLYNKLKLQDLPPFFAIASILTLFAHNFKPTDNCNDIIFRIFDLIISSQSMFIPIIMYAKMIIISKEELLQLYEDNLENFDGDIDLIHGIMQQQLNKTMDDINFWDTVLKQTVTKITKKYKSYFKDVHKTVNKYSVLLNTASGKEHKYNIDNVLNLLDKEIKENHQPENVNRSLLKVRLRKIFSNDGDELLQKNMLFKVSVVVVMASFIYKAFTTGITDTLDILDHI